MKTKQKLSTQEIDKALADLTEGIQPVVNNLDIGKLSGAEREDILKHLDALESKALEIKRALK